MTRRLAGILALLFLLAGLPPATRIDAAPPTGFTDETVPGLTNLDGPTAFAFLPDGSMLITLKAGRLRLYQGGALRATDVFDGRAKTCFNSERGLLGVAVDPEFATNRYIYVYYTFNKHNTPNPCPIHSPQEPVNRVSRLTLSAGLTTAAETVLIDNISSKNGNHNAGDLQFGKDGYLYVSVGDAGADAETARELFNLNGSILRITREGDIPPDNPFQGANTARCNTGPTSAGNRCREIFAYGLRNPFRLAFDPNAAGTRFFINDVGAGTVEEISEGRLGGDFGWPCFEGTRTNQTGDLCSGVTLNNTVRPSFEYRREVPFTDCSSITGGAFVPTGVWPSQYEGAYIFGDYVCGKLFVLLPEQGGLAAQLFDGAVDAPTHIAFGPDGALYYARYNQDAIHRVRFTGTANRSPVARIAAQPTAGDPPLLVAFDASASSDPDSGDSIVAYLWDFGDESPARETASPTTSYSYATPGTYEASVRARDSQGATSALATIRIDVGNAPPTAQILAPAAGARFTVGQQITLRGAGSDPEDGALGGASLRWKVRRHHDTHSHPYFSGEGAEATITAPAPEDLGAVGTSWLEVELTAVDALGASSALVTVEVRPQIVSLILETEPPGLVVSVGDGVSTASLSTPATVQSWPGWALALGAPAGQQAGGVEQKLCGWSHGGRPSHTLITPAQPTSTLRAIFGPAGEPCTAQIGDAQVFLPMVAR